MKKNAIRICLALLALGAGLVLLSFPRPDAADAPADRRAPSPDTPATASTPAEGFVHAPEPPRAAQAADLAPHPAPDRREFAAADSAAVQHPPEGMARSHWRNAANVLMNRVAAHTDPSVALRELLAYFDHPAPDSVIRDYALQHLADETFFRRQPPQGRREISLRLRQALSETENNICGTAALAAARIALRHPDSPEAGRLNEAVAAAIHHPGLARAAKLSLAHAGAMLGIRAARPVIETWAAQWHDKTLAAAAASALKHYEQHNTRRPTP